jgi:dihydrofolate reductase
MKIIAIAAISIDAKIATHSKHFSNWTSIEDKDFLHSALDKCDVVIVGNNTYKTAKKSLSKRNCIVLTGLVKTIFKKSNNLAYCNPKNANLLDQISKYKLVAVLGGTQTYSYCLENNLLDELFITIEPLIFGRGLNIFYSEKIKTIRFQLISIKELNKLGSLLLHYKKN